MNKQKVWKETKLQDICIFKTGKLNSNAAVLNGKYPFFTCSPEILKINSYSFDTEAVLLAGNNADGKFNVKLYKGKFDAYQRTYVINANENNAIINKYLYYALWLQLNYLKDVSMGTATKFLTMSILNNIKIPLPPLPEQHAIAEILSSIDDKIELNNQMNRTLEAMAQAIFKQWFVDFKYPTSSTLPLSKGEMSRSDRGGGKMIDSELGPIPEGWRVMNLGELCEVKSGKRLPKGHTLTKIKTSHPYIRIRDLTNKTVSISDLEYVKDGTINKIKKYIITKDDVYISIVAVVGLVGLVPSILDGANLTENCARLTNLKIITKEYLSYFLNSEQGQKDIHSLTVGTTQKKLALFRIEKLKILLPDEVYIQSFTRIIESINKQIEHNILQSQTLSALRDSLLPKLMSGVLRVPEEIVKRYENV